MFVREDLETALEAEKACDTDDKRARNKHHSRVAVMVDSTNGQCIDEVQRP